MNATKSVQFVLESSFEQVPKAGDALKEICSESLLSQAELYMLELSLVEALNNIIMHSYEYKPGMLIKVDIILGSDGIEFHICDTGISKKDFLDKIHWKFDPDNMTNIPEKGMGLYIIHQIMDDVTYDSRNGSNIICMRKKLNK